MKIVLIEDTVMVVEVLTQILQNIYRECSLVIPTFATEHDAVRAITGEHSAFDALLLDGNLALGGSGMEVLKVMTDTQKQRTIITSGNQEFINEALQFGAATHLDKGFEHCDIDEIGNYTKRTIDSVINK